MLNTHAHTRIRRERSSLCCQPAGLQRPKTKVNKQRASTERKRVGERVSEWHASRYVRIAFSVTLSNEIHIELRGTQTHTRYICMYAHVSTCYKKLFLHLFHKIAQRTCKPQQGERQQATTTRTLPTKQANTQIRKYYTQCALSQSVSLPLNRSPALPLNRSPAFPLIHSRHEFHSKTSSAGIAHHQT